MDEGQILERLVAHYSPSGHERGAVVEFVRLSRELGYRARIDAVGNGIAEVGRGLPTILFLGHIDTVPGRRATTRWRWRSEPVERLPARAPSGWWRAWGRRRTAGARSISCEERSPRW